MTCSIAIEICFLCVSLLSLSSSSLFAKQHLCENSEIQHNTIPIRLTSIFVNFHLLNARERMIACAHTPDCSFAYTFSCNGHSKLYLVERRNKEKQNDVRMFAEAFRVFAWPIKRDKHTWATTNTRTIPRNKRRRVNKYNHKLCGSIRKTTTTAQEIEFLQRQPFAEGLTGRIDYRRVIYVLWGYSVTIPLWQIIIINLTNDKYCVCPCSIDGFACCALQ